MGKTPVSPDLLELEVHRSWTNHIEWVHQTIPFGQVCIKVVNGNPGKLVHEHTFFDIRFDQDLISPKPIEDIDFAKLEPQGTKKKGSKGKNKKAAKQSEVVLMKVPVSWINLIYFCKTILTNGQLCYQTIKGEPRSFVKELSELDIDFSLDKNILPANYVHLAGLGKKLAKST